MTQAVFEELINKGWALNQALSIVNHSMVEIWVYVNSSWTEARHYPSVVAAKADLPPQEWGNIFQTVTTFSPVNSEEYYAN